LALLAGDNASDLAATIRATLRWHRYRPLRSGPSACWHSRCRPATI